MRLDRLTLRLILAQSIDAATFLVFYLAIGPGIHEERNPLILFLMALGGLHMVALAKVGLSLVVSYRYHHTRKPLSVRYVRARTIAISAATASGIVGAGFNLAAIVSS